ncbi:hypothetical protein G6F65_023268 [Rhizopus arrhizus]|nr:hypothetical protein G6F65_023268 [Rhizopus arrhizus]
MSASATPPASVTHFSASELDMLAKTADALSAYLGKPVLAEVILGDEGTEWKTRRTSSSAAPAPASWATAAACPTPTTTPTIASTSGPSRFP